MPQFDSRAEGGLSHTLMQGDDRPPRSMEWRDEGNSDLSRASPVFSYFASHSAMAFISSSETCMIMAFMAAVWPLLRLPLLMSFI